MSDGRTFWWAKDAAWYRRERQADLAIMFGPLGLSALDWLCCYAKELNDGGRVKSGYSAIALGIGATGQVEDVRGAVRYAATVGALDDFEEDDAKRFVCRISGWQADQDRLLRAEQNRRAYAKRSHSDSAVIQRDVSAETETETEKEATTDSLRSSVDARWHPLLDLLAEVAAAKASRPWTAVQVVSCCERYGDRDHLAEARAFRLYFIDGAGENRKVKSLPQTWGNWLGRAPSAAKRNPHSTALAPATRVARPGKTNAAAMAALDRLGRRVWTEDEWEAFVGILELGFAGEFTADEQRVYRLMLDQVHPADAMRGLDQLADRGQKFRPGIGELRGAAKPYRDQRRAIEWAASATERLREKHRQLDAAAALPELPAPEQGDHP